MPNARFPVASIQRLWEIAAAESGDALFGLRVGSLTRPGAFHALGLGIVSSGSVLEALRRIARYSSVVSTNGRFTLRERDGELALVMQPEDVVVLPTVHSVDATVVAMCRMLENCAGPSAIPAKVVFMRPRVAPPEAYRGLLRCPVEFDGPHVASVCDEEAEATAEWLATRVVPVASRDCPEALAGVAPRKLYEMVEGLICCLVHDKGELTREDIANATLVFHGNSGAAGLVAIGPRVFATPGHLRALDPDGRPPTFALLEVSPPALELTVFAATGEVLRRERAELAARERVTVR